MDRPFRMCVADIFKGMGSGFTVVGKIEAGSVQCGDRILAMPIGEPATVKGWYLLDILCSIASAVILLLRSYAKLSPKTSLLLQTMHCM